MNILISAIIGGGIGSVVGLLFHLAARRFSPKVDRAASFVGLLVTIAIFGVLRNHGTIEQVTHSVAKPFQSTQERLLDDYGSSLVEAPEFQAAFAGLTPEQAQQKGFELAARGISRLDDRALRQRAEILARILPQLGEPACASMARGVSSPEVLTAIQSTLKDLDTTSLALWLDLSRNAMLAELRQTPRPTVTDEQVNAAFSALADSWPQADVDRLNALHDLSTASDTDACWVVRTLYRTATELPEPHGTVLVRALVSS